MRLFLYLALFNILSADPWGKDADLCSKRAEGCVPKQNIAQKFAEVCIKFHQDVISPADGPRSHFLPSSSQYTLDAIKQYGFIQGFMMGCDRLQRENKEDWVYMKGMGNDGMEIKLDPVPRL